MATIWFMMTVRQPLHILAMMEVRCSAMDAVRTEAHTARVGIGDCVCYCEPCMLKYITEGAVFTPLNVSYS